MESTVFRSSQNMGPDPDFLQWFGESSAGPLRGCDYKPTLQKTNNYQRKWFWISIITF